MLIAIVNVAGAGNALAHGDLHGVIDRLTIQLASDPRSVSLLLRRAEMHRLHHAFEQSDADFARALVLEPANPDARWMRARARLEGGQPDKALAELDAFVGEHPSNPSARLTRARALTALGRIADAAVEYGEALRQLQQPEPDHYFELFRAERSAGVDPRKRLATVNAALSRTGAVPSLEDAALDVEIEIGDYDAALARLDRRAAGAPRQENWQFRRGQVLKLAKRDAEAAAAFTQCLAAIESLPSTLSRTTAIATLARDAQSALDALRWPHSNQ